MMKKQIFLIALWISFNASYAQTLTPVPSYSPPDFKSWTQPKNFFLLSLFQELPDARDLLMSDETLRHVLNNKLTAAKNSLKSCKGNISCYAASLKWTDEEVSAVSSRLKELYLTGNALPKLVNDHLIPSGCYGMYAVTAPRDLLIKAWEQDAKAINYTIGVYVEGNKPNYPNIDSIFFNVHEKQYIEIVSTSLHIISQENPQLFFAPSLSFALQALELNGRDNAADFEPMTSTVNQAAISQISKTNWEKYPYSIILVPGAGPDDKETELSAGGILRCRLAAQQYRKGAAPFIMVSGGRVHPYKTKYSEALEMKKFLTDVMGIPGSAIIMEPHARHTTTNMRNAARLIFRYGIPMSKPAITTTTKSQSYYISDTVRERSLKELGYYPYNNGKRLSDYDMEFYPLATSLQIDFDEPLDP